MNVDTQSRLFFNLNNNGTLSGNLTIQNLTVSKIGQNSLSGDGNIVKNNATQFVKILLEKKVNERLSRGYVLSGDQIFLPLMNQQKLNITYGPRYARISSDLNINQTKLTKLAEKALSNVGSST
uniref:Uncharacterized protein n=1 Tax=Romanomermis culicivorax TaxID=13658 RepID=A0A915KVH2_ROMCU